MKTQIRMAFAAVALLLFVPVMMQARPVSEGDGHQLTALWKKFEEASKADRPQTEAKILSQIKEEAVRRRLPVDFYDAAKAYVNSVQRRDWKKRAELRQQLSDEVKSFDEPIVTYLWMNEFAGASTDERWAFVQSRSEAFEGRHPAFYGLIGGMMGGVLGDFVADDREFVLWHLLTGRSYSDPGKDEVYRALKKKVAGRYPSEAWLEYYQAARISDRDARKHAFEMLSGKYAGKAVSLFPREDLLSMEMDLLEKNGAPAAEYEALYRRLESFERDRKAFKGDEARIAGVCRGAERLMARLKAKELSVQVHGKEVHVLFRNLDKATLTLYRDDKKQQVWQVVNPDRSFYVFDTVKMALPVLGDGEYRLEAVNGKISGSGHYVQYTLSAAHRQDARGRAVYVTDHMSGKPLSKARLVLRKGDSVVASETVSLNGFTVLPKKFQKLLDGNGDIYYTLTAESGSGNALRSSPRLGLRNEPAFDGFYSYTDGVYCDLYKDQGAYNPGDTVRFKAVVYKGDLVEQVAVVPGRSVEVVLYDSERNELERKKFVTNEFGSVSGAFSLPKGLRNGYFRLAVFSDGHILTDEHFRVDEFVLPTFTLSFDRNEKLYFPGDEVTVSGRVTGYSGHSMTGASLAVKVQRFGTVIQEMDLSPEADGSFSITFPAPMSGPYSVDVKVTDATGETRDFGTGLYISERIQVNAVVVNGADGEVVTMDQENRIRPMYVRRSHYGVPSCDIVEGNGVRLSLEVFDSNGSRVPVPVSYRVISETGVTVREGTAVSGADVDVDMAGLPSGLYTVKAEASVRDASGAEIRDEDECRVLVLLPSDTVLDAPVRRVFVSGPSEVAAGDRIRLRMGTADGAEWAVVTLFGKDREILATRKVELAGVRARRGSLITVEMPYQDSYPDAVRLQVFYFKRGEAVTFDREYSRKRTRLSLPLSFDRFVDKAYPGTSYTFSLHSAPGVEALAAVYDKSLDAVAGNWWPVVSLRDFSVPYVSVAAACGRVSGEDMDVEYEEAALLGSTRMMAKSAGVVNDMMVMEAPMAESEDAIPEDRKVVADAGGDVEIRSKFESALTFQPHLRSDVDGNITFSFRTSDKLSTYYVSVFAHDKDMRNALVREEMVVSLPVRVAVVEPQFLYAGDAYEVGVSVSSVAQEPVSGQLYLYVYPSSEYEGVEPLSVQRLDVTVPAGGVESCRFPVKVPSVDTLGLKVVFAASDFSDGIFLPVPVKKPVQTLTEAHSAVLRAGMDREALLKELRGRFVNADGKEASLEEISILDMVRAAIPARTKPSGKDVLSLSEAYYVGLLGERLAHPGGSVSGEGELLERILGCRNGDGGFGWFEGMDSSPVITGVILSRFAKLRDRGFDVPDLTSSVRFIDRQKFLTERPLWCGALSDAQYMFIRSQYAEVPFEVEPVTAAQKKFLSEFRKNAKTYLVPSASVGRGLQGQIMAKARRTRTLELLSASREGVALAQAWGVKLATGSKLQRSLQADVLSLKEYAVEHRDGGWYYPNAVMPWRGLLETEADAHAILCDLLDPYDGSLSDGIRLWLMLQKETQHWDETPAFVDALTAILDGSEAMLGTRVLSLKTTYSKPFEDIAAAGNGFTIERRFFREETVEQVYDNRTSDRNDLVSKMVEIQPGTPLSVGDRIVAEYRIWNGENRSFVKVDAFREAALRPSEQLSGSYGWGRVRPMYGGVVLSFTPQGYRNVKADCTEYYFDTFPEENTVLTETFFVTQAGTFTAPVVTVESLYAPHYRANGGWTGLLQAE